MMAQPTRHSPGGGKPARVSGRGARARKPVRPRPRLTSMIDVTFLLLLFFLLAFTFREAEGRIPGVLPERDIIVKHPPTLLKQITIRVRPVRASATYEISCSPGLLRDPGQLHRALAALRKRLGPEVPVVVKARRDVRWRFAVEALNQAVRAGFGAVRIEGDI